MKRNSSAPHAPKAPSIDASELQIRHVRTHREFAQCVELQAATWGAGFREAMPATILKITQRLGGVTAGAFAPDGALLGFVFGITGIEQGAVVHWSDLLAVDARVQNAGIGRRLKEFQRDAARAVGATRMYWTFDPLVARNAHFNLHRLGARVSEYVPDMYGVDTGSALHHGMGTDRFIVVWPLDATAPTGGTAGRRSAVAREAWADAPVLNATTRDALPHNPPPLARVAIPADIFRLQQDALDEAIRWRHSTRQAFQWALSNGYRIDGFQRDPLDAGGHYLLTHPRP